MTNTTLQSIYFYLLSDATSLQEPQWVETAYYLQFTQL